MLRRSRSVQILQHIIQPKRFDIFFPDWEMMLRRSGRVLIFRVNLKVSCRVFESVLVILFKEKSDHT